MEHYRGRFSNRAMYAPLIASALTGLAATRAAASRDDGTHRPRASPYVAALIVGSAGLGFHLYNIVKRPGGVSWLNLFYAAPVAAPAALSVAGVIGLAADHVAAQPPGNFRRRRFGRVLGLLASLGLIGTTAEAALLHFRGAFHNPVMWIPVSLPPLAAAMLAHAVLARRRSVDRLTRAVLRLTAVAGFAGVGAHAYGVARGMGGWCNWTQNVLAGPPLPAPPSFAALAFAGLAALRLMGGRGREPEGRRSGQAVPWLHVDPATTSGAVRGKASNLRMNASSECLA
jgi:hypothetical protein